MLNKLYIIATVISVTFILCIRILLFSFVFVCTHEHSQVALELLEILFENKELHQNENKSKRVREQLQNQTVAVSVLGRHGVGKSTLLDSLLNER